MKHDNPNDPHNIAGQSLWRQRIIKENAINAKPNKDGFSIQSCLKDLKVPMRFKPGQINHFAKEEVVVDPETERILRATLAAKKAPPAEQLLWPETSQHDFGWLVQENGPGLPLSERGTLAGLPPRHGFGWLTPSPPQALTTPRQNVPLLSMPSSSSPPTPAQRSARQMNHARYAHSRPISSLTQPMTERGTSSTSSTLLFLDRRERRQMNAKEQLAAFLQKEQEWKEDVQTRKQRRLARWKAKQEAQNEKSIHQETASATQATRPTAMNSGPRWLAPAGSQGLRKAVKIQFSNPWETDGALVSNPAALRPESSHQRAVAEAAKRSRGYLNGPDNKWYKPKGTCDVVAFADAYVREWGVSIYQKVPEAPSATIAATSQA